MLSLLCALAFAASTPALAATPVAEEGSAAPTQAQPAPRSAADTVVAAAFGGNVGTSPTELKAESTGPVVGLSTLIVPLLAISALGLLTALVTRRRAAPARAIRIVESATLGPKRTLVIADVLGERLVLGVSEAGIAVLSARAAPEPVAAPVTMTMPQAERMPLVERLPAPAARMGFWERVFGPRKAPARSFDAELAESMEDQELRAKLAAGMKGTVS